MATADTTQPVTGNASVNFTYLALGDSYTIGHDVLPQDNYPNQTIRLVQKDSMHPAVKIIAVTGWTTANLIKAIQNNENSGALMPKYDLVTLLIGVNNQYQGQAIELYTTEFESLLKQSIAFAGNNADHVVVLSIPDWSATQFAAGLDRIKISKEIDAYNAVNKTLSEEYGVHYMNITPLTREAANDPTLIASDGLHPSGKEYARWAKTLAGLVKKMGR